LPPKTYGHSIGNIAKSGNSNTLRQQLGLARGSRVIFQLTGDHIEVRLWKLEQPIPASAFGMLHSQRPPVPVDFNPASLLRPYRMS